MTWSLISYSMLAVPLIPYNINYAVGIVENENSERLIVQLDTNIKEYSIGLSGEIKKIKGPTGDINIFVAKANNDYTNSAKDISPEAFTIGIIGTGTMGLGITQAIVQSGYKVIFKSICSEMIKLAIKKMENNLLKIMTPIEKDEILSNIVPTVEYKDLLGVDLIIECVTEDIKTKQLIFQELNELSLNNTIIATNTSSLSIDDLASFTSNASKFLGIHFFNPVTKMRLVEVVKGVNTSQETIDVSIRFIKCLNKIPIIIKNSPGFIVNRLLFSMINEACYMLEEGVASVGEIDDAMKLGANHPMGPFELLDVIGIDISCNIINRLNNLLPNFRKPTQTLTNMLDSQTLGRKTKKGFYEY